MPFGRWMIPPAQFDLAEVAQRAALATLVPGALAQRGRLLEMIGGVGVASLPQAQKAHAGQDPGLTAPVTEVPEQAQRPLHLADSLVAAQHGSDEAQIGQHPRFARVVISRAIRRQGLLEMGGRPVPEALPHVHDAEIVTGVGLGGPVAELAGRLTGVTMDDQSLRVVASRLKIGKQGRRKPDGVTGSAVPGRVPGHGDQTRPFGAQPGQRGGLAGDGRSGCWCDGGHAAAIGGEGSADRDHRSMQVVVEQAGQGDPALVLASWPGGELVPVAAQQVVHAVPGRPCGLEHASAGQCVQQRPGLPRRSAGERGHGVAIEVRARVQGRPPERPGGAVRQLPVGPENAARTSAAGSLSSANASRPGCVSRSAATSARVRSGRVAARAAMMPSAGPDAAAAVAFEGPSPKYCWRPPNGQRRRGVGGQIWEAMEARFPRAKVWAVVATETAMVPPHGSATGPASGSRASCTTATPNTSRRANKTAPAPGPRRICSS